LSYYDYAYSLGGDRLGFRIPLMAHLRIYILDARAVPSLYLGIAGGGLLGYTHYYNKASNLKVETPWDSELAWQALAGYSFPVNKRLSGYVEFDYTMRYDRDKALEGTEKFHIIGLHGGIQWHIGRKRPR
jgi:hypothetical protein